MAVTIVNRLVSSCKNLIQVTVTQLNSFYTPSLGRLAWLGFPTPQACLTFSPRLRSWTPYQRQLPGAVGSRPAASLQMRLSQYRFYLASDQALARRKASHPKLAPSHHTTPHLDQYRVPAVAAAPLDLIPPTTPCRLQLRWIPVWEQGR